MAHKTMIGGTAYEIKGGRTLVNGTGYEIKKGRTLVGGTGYDVSFGPDGIPVEITTYMNITNATATATINGTVYNYPVSDLLVQPGDKIVFYVIGSTIAGTINHGTVKVDGTQVFAAGTSGGNYTWTVPSGITSIAILLTIVNAFGGGSVQITTS